MEAKIAQEKAKVAMEKAKAKAEADRIADEKRRTKADGLIYFDNGTRIDSGSRQVVNGVNLHAQKNSTSQALPLQNQVQAE